MAAKRITPTTQAPEAKSTPSDSGGLPALSSMLTFIERAARDPSFDVAKFSILLDRQEALLKQHQMALYDSAFTDMQMELTEITKSGRNPTFANPYAKLEDLDAAARPIWTKYGFGLRFGTKPPRKDGWLTETLTISHRGGWREEIELEAPIDYQNSGYRSRTPVQAVGSTVTYLRRYLMGMGLNLVPKNDPADNDGEPYPSRRAWAQRGQIDRERADREAAPPPEDHVPEEEWTDADGTSETSDDEANFKTIALEAAAHGREQLGILYKNTNARNRQRIKDWQAELEAAYPKDE